MFFTISIKLEAVFSQNLIFVRNSCFLFVTLHWILIGSVINILQQRERFDFYFHSSGNYSYV